MDVICTTADSEDASELGYFFQTAGAIKFSDAGFESPGFASTVVVADRYGVIVYSDLQAVYVSFTNQLLKAASNEVKSPELLDPATICVAKLSVPAVHCLSLSADQLLLACVAGSIVQVFSLPNLLHHQSDAPLHSFDLISALLQFSWCPDSSERDGLRYLALTADRVLLHGNLLSGTEAVAEQVSSVCWAPDGQHFAYSTGSKLVVTAPDWKDSAFAVNITELEGESGEGELVVDSLLWPLPNAITASCLWYDNSVDEPEGADGYLLGVTWSTWQGSQSAAPEGLQAQLTSYVSFDEDPGCPPREWPYLRGVPVGAWQLYVHSHRRANDEHIRLMDLSKAGEVVTLDQGETKLLAAVPTVNDRENFVVGLAVDYSNQEAIPHPTDVEKPDVPASCILAVATVDGVLRLYRLANFIKDTGLARAPAQVPAALPPHELSVLQAAAKQDLLEEESEASVSSPSPPIASFMQSAKAAVPAGPSSPAFGIMQQQAAGRQQLQQQPLQPTPPAAVAGPEAAAAAVKLPSDDFEDDDEDDDDEDVDVDDAAQGTNNNAAEGGWGSSEDGEEPEATSAARAAGSSSLTSSSQPAASVFGGGGGGAAVAAAASSQANSNSMFGTKTSFSGIGQQVASPLSQPLGFSQPFAAAAQPFGSSSGKPAFTFAVGDGVPAGMGSVAEAKPATAATGAKEGGLAAGQSVGITPALGSGRTSSDGGASGTPAFNWPAPAGAAPAFGSVPTAPFGSIGAAATTPLMPASGPFATSAFTSLGLATPPSAATASTPAPDAASFASALGAQRSTAVPATAAFTGALGAAGSSAPAFGKAVTTTAAPQSSSGEAVGAGSSAPAFGAVSFMPGFGGNSAAACGTPGIATLDAATVASRPSPFAGLASGGPAAVFGAPVAAPQPSAVGALPVQKGAFALPTEALAKASATAAVPADRFQPSPSFQGQRQGFVFTTGQYGTGYYLENLPQVAPAAKSTAGNQPAAAATTPQPQQRGQQASCASRQTLGQASSDTSAAASTARPPAAAAAAAAAARRAAQQGMPQARQQQQQQQQPSKVPSLPTVKVSDPKPQLVDQGQEVAEAEAAFLRSLQAVRQMSAQLQALVAQEVPKHINSWNLTQQTSHLRQEARKLSQTHKEQKQVVVRLLDSWEEVNRQQAALVMFHPESARTDAIQSQLPLEPALAALRDGVQVSFEAISSNMEDLEQQLERWQQQMGPKSANSAVRTPSPLLARTGSSSNVFAAANGTGCALKAAGFKASPWVAGARVIGSAVRGPATPSKAAGGVAVSPGTAAAAAAAGGGGVNAQVELLYKIVSAQQDTAANLQARISGLSQQLELLGVIKTDTEHQGGKTLGRWGEELAGIDDSDSAYGSDPGAEDEEDEYERGTPSSVPAPALGAGALLGGFPAARTPPAATGLAAHGYSAARSSPSSSIASRLQVGSGTPAGRHPHQQQPFRAGDVSGSPLGGGSKLHWVTPGLPAAAGGQRTPATSAGKSSGKRQVQPGASSASSSAAWHKMAVELSNSTGRSGGQGSTGGGSRQRVRATVATPLPHSSSSTTGRRLSGQKQQPVLTSSDRPASPLHISAATAVADVAAGGGAPSVGFTFPGQPAGAAGAGQTPAAPSSSRLPGKLNFSPAAPTTATGTTAALGGVSAARRANAGTPAASAAAASPAAAAAAAAVTPSGLNFFSANPLYDQSPGWGVSSPLTAVPSPALHLGAAGAAGKAASSQLAASVSGFGQAPASLPAFPASPAGGAAGSGLEPAASPAAGQGSQAGSSAAPPAGPTAGPASRTAAAAGLAGAKAKSSQPPEPPVQQLQQAVAFQQKVMQRQSSAGSTASSPLSAAPLAAAKKASSQPPEPPSSLSHAAAQAGSQLLKQAAPPPAARPSSSALAAAAAAAGKILAQEQQQGSADSKQGQVAAAAAAAAAAAKPKAAAAGSQPPEPPAQLTQQAEAARQKLLAAAAAAAAAAPAANAKISAAASGQPPDPPGNLLQAAVIKQAEAAAAAAGAAAGAALISPAAASRAGSVSNTSASAVDALSAMIGASGAGAFGGFGALGLGAESGSSAVKSNSTTTPSSPFNGQTASVFSSTAPAFGFSSAPAASAASSAAPFGSFGSSAAGSAPAWGSAASAASAFGSTSFVAPSALAAGGSSSSSPFGSLLVGSGTANSGAFAASSNAGATQPLFGASSGSSSSSSLGGPTSLFAPASAAATGASVFGSSTAGGAVLGGSTLGAGTGSGSVFGSTTAGSQFTPASTLGTGNALFGSPSVFGAGSAAATPGSSMFGATAASAASPSVFGAPAASSGFGTPAATQGSSNVFGSSMPAAVGGFGQSSPFGTPGTAPGSSNVFNAAAAASSPFGTTASSPFGAAAAPPASGALAGGFGNPSLFGQQQQQATPGSGGTSFAAFGQPATPAAPFGQPASPAAPFSSPSAFGQPSTPASGFGQPAFGGAATPVVGGGFAAFSGSAGQAASGSSAGGFAAFAGSASGGGFSALAGAAGGSFGTAAFGTASSPAFGSTAGQQQQQQQQQFSMWGGPRR